MPIIKVPAREVTKRVVHALRQDLITTDMDVGNMSTEELARRLYVFKASELLTPSAAALQKIRKMPELTFYQKRSEKVAPGIVGAAADFIDQVRQEVIDDREVTRKGNVDAKRRESMSTAAKFAEKFTGPNISEEEKQKRAAAEEARNKELEQVGARASVRSLYGVGKPELANLMSVIPEFVISPLFLTNIKAFLTPGDWPTLGGKKPKEFLVDNLSDTDIAAQKILEAVADMIDDPTKYLANLAIKDKSGLKIQIQEMSLKLLDAIGESANITPVVKEEKPPVGIFRRPSLTTKQAASVPSTETVVPGGLFIELDTPIFAPGKANAKEEEAKSKEFMPIVENLLVDLKGLEIIKITDLGAAGYKLEIKDGPEGTFIPYTLPKGGGSIDTKVLSKYLCDAIYRNEKSGYKLITIPDDPEARQKLKTFIYAYSEQHYKSDQNGGVMVLLKKIDTQPKAEVKTPSPTTSPRGGQQAPVERRMPSPPPVERQQEQEGTRQPSPTPASALPPLPPEKTTVPPPRPRRAAGNEASREQQQGAAQSQQGAAVPPPRPSREKTVPVVVKQESKVALEPVSGATSAISEADNAKFVKYLTMQRVGLEFGAIELQMKRDGVAITASEAERVFKAKLTSDEPIAKAPFTPAKSSSGGVVTGGQQQSSQSQQAQRRPSIITPEALLERREQGLKKAPPPEPRKEAPTTAARRPSADMLLGVKLKKTEPQGKEAKVSPKAVQDSGVGGGGILEALAGRMATQRKAVAGPDEDAEDILNKNLPKTKAELQEMKRELEELKDFEGDKDKIEVIDKKIHDVDNQLRSMGFSV